VADKAFDADTLLDCINRKNAKAVIAPKAYRKEHRPFDQYQYQYRNVVERFFARLKQFRHIATRHDKIASRFASFVALVAPFLW
jgi:transposase